MDFDVEMRDAELSDADSLASTAESEPQDEYEVETILFEDEDNGDYLVKWAGYPENRATWEGPESFHNLSETMEDWKQIKREISQGLRDPLILINGKKSKRGSGETKSVDGETARSRERKGTKGSRVSKDPIPIYRGFPL